MNFTKISNTILIYVVAIALQAFVISVIWMILAASLAPTIVLPSLSVAQIILIKIIFDIFTQNIVKNETTVELINIRLLLEYIIEKDNEKNMLAKHFLKKGLNLDFGKKKETEENID